MPGKQAKRKALATLPRHEWTAKQKARRRAAIIARLSTVIAKLRKAEEKGERLLGTVERYYLSVAINAADRARERIQDRLT